MDEQVSCHNAAAADTGDAMKGQTVSSFEALCTHLGVSSEIRFIRIRSQQDADPSGSATADLRQVRQCLNRYRNLRRGDAGVDGAELSRKFTRGFSRPSRAIGEHIFPLGGPTAFGRASPFAPQERVFATSSPRLNVRDWASQI